MWYLKKTLRIEPSAEQRWGNTHKGETAIVIGNGDSLKSVPKELLNKYPSFGVNLIPMRPFQPTYFSCIGTKYLTKFAASMYDIATGADIVFLSALHLKDNIPDLQKLYALDNVQLVDEDTMTFPGEYFMTGGTVTYVNLKIAYFMGFETVLLVGCDFEKAWGHFYGNSINKPPRENEWRDMTDHLFFAGEAYKKAGRRIVNLSPPSTLDAFFERGDVVEG